MIIEQLDFIYSKELVPYEESHRQMRMYVDEILESIQKNEARKGVIWGLEHPSLYTKGRSAESSELLQTPRAPVYDVERGGKYTYHGPGQLVI